MSTQPTTRDPIERMFQSNQAMQRGIQSAQELGCCKCEGDGAIIVTSMIAGEVIAIIATAPTGAHGALYGWAIGGAVGITAVAIKNSVKEGRCVIL